MSLDENKSRKQQDISEVLPVYNSAMFDSSDTFSFNKPIVLRYDVSHMHKTLVSELSVQFTQDDDNEYPNRMMVIGYSLDAKVGEQRNIRMLTDALDISKR